jgi:hypothetical protein
MRFLLGASSAEKLCAVGTKGRRFWGPLNFTVRCRVSLARRPFFLRSIGAVTVRLLRSATIILSALLGGTACVSTDALKAISAGQTGCTPEQLTISNVQHSMFSMVGMWNATCSGKTCLCSAVATGKSSTEYSCALAQQSTRQLTIVGVVREALLAWLRGRRKTLCARVPRPAWLPGPSTSPLDVMLRAPVILSCLAGAVFYTYYAWVRSDRDAPLDSTALFRSSGIAFAIAVVLALVLVMRSVIRFFLGASGAEKIARPRRQGPALRCGPLTSPLGVRMQCTRAALILGAVFLFSAVALGAEKGWFGLGVSVDVDGLSLNPTLRTITVQKVFTSSPAASAGIVPGDTLVEVEGIVVAGSKADLIKAAMQKSVGQTLHLKVRRSTADIREVSMVAVPRPVGQ